MFILVALIAALGYALQSTLMTSYYRSIDKLSAIAYRGLSLGISMIPLLFFVSPEKFSHLFSQLPLIIYAAILAAIGNVCSARSYSHLPVGIATAASMSFLTLFTAIVSYIFLGEAITLWQGIFSALILSGISLLSLTRSKGPLPKEYSVKRGISNSLLYGALLGCAFALVGKTSRDLHPFLVAYCWEFSIGLIAAFIAILRGRLSKAGLQPVSRKDFGRILLFSSPTVIGTGGYALAMTMGPIAIAAAIISTMMVFSTLLAKFLYGEELTFRQWCLLLFVCGAVAGLKIFG